MTEYNSPTSQQQSEDKNQRIRLVLAYDGTDFHGWQKQPNQESVQSTVESVLTKVFNTEVTTVGSGRTDAGVHALEQNLHFNLKTPLKHPDLLYALNRLLPSSIRVQKAFFAPQEFHAQHSAQQKLYRYRILQTKVLCPLRRNFTWWPAYFLDKNTMNEMAQTLLGQQDFKSFQSSGTPVKSTVRTIHRAEWQMIEDELVFEVEGDGFLKQMVRNIVGSMVHFALKSKTPTQDMKSLISATDRKLAAPPAPAQGLCLVKVYYPTELECQCEALPKKISH